MRRFRYLPALFLTVASISVPVLAHHSTAAYDYTKMVPLSGTVVNFQWTNPHMFIHVAVQSKGKTMVYAIESGTPNINVRHGWKKNDLKPGDKVKLVIRPMRDGSLGGTLDNIMLADGRQLWGPAHDIAPQ